MQHGKGTGFCIWQLSEKLFNGSLLMDHENYARFLPVYYYDMLNLHTTNPDVHEAFVQGNFCIQLDSCNSFSRLSVNEVIEKTVNMDTQTAGRTKGFS